MRGTVTADFTRQRVYSCVGEAGSKAETPNLSSLRIFHRPEIVAGTRLHDGLLVACRALRCIGSVENLCYATDQCGAN